MPKAKVSAHPMDTAVFECSLPEITTAIKAGGDGMRIQLDIPENQSGEAVKIFGMKGKLLKVTVEVVTQSSMSEDPYKELF